MPHVTRILSATLCFQAGKSFGIPSTHPLALVLVLRILVVSKSHQYRGPSGMLGAVMVLMQIGLVVLVIIGAAILITWGALYVLVGVPPPVYEHLIKNYMIGVFWPAWALIAWALIFGFGKAEGAQTLSGKFAGLEISGSGGSSVVWGIITLLGWIVIATYWKA